MFKGTVILSKALYKYNHFHGLNNNSICQHSLPLRDNTDLKTSCIRAIKMYCYDYIVPMAGSNPFRMIPYSLYSKEITDEKYRIFDGELKYRFFSPSGISFYQGLTSHLLSNAVGLLMASELLSDTSLASLAGNQVEWVMGCNPENACLMTAEGINNPFS